MLEHIPVTMKKTENLVPWGDGTRRTEGFWLPIRLMTSFPKENLLRVADCVYEPGDVDGEILTWMEYDPEEKNFIGSIDFGPVGYHIWASRYHEKDGGLWEVEDEDMDTYICAAGDGDRPIRFKVEGYDGEWVCVASPFM